MDDQFGWIDRWKFDWPSFATLTTGLLAVGGAIYIGIQQITITRSQVDIAHKQTEIMSRQVDIASKQTTIMGQQASLQQLTLKADLYEKRLKVYTDVRDYADTLSNAGKKIPYETKNNFLISLESSKFLFNTDVYREVVSIWINVDNLHKEIRDHINAHAPYQDNFQLDLRYWQPKMEMVAEQVQNLSTSILPFMRLDENVAVPGD